MRFGPKFKRGKRREEKEKRGEEKRGNGRRRGEREREEKGRQGLQVLFLCDFRSATYITYILWVLVTSRDALLRSELGVVLVMHLHVCESIYMNAYV